jgi:hypothetical protein
LVGLTFGPELHRTLFLAVVGTGRDCVMFSAFFGPVRFSALFLALAPDLAPDLAVVGFVAMVKLAVVYGRRV